MERVIAVAALDSDSTNERSITKRYLYKNQKLFPLVNKVKLWPSRTGILHGVKHLSKHSNQWGDTLNVVTHCGEEFTVQDSKNSRSARWLRNRLFKKPCPKCGVPEWKLEKYSQTTFTRTQRADKRG